MYIYIYIYLRLCSTRLRYKETLVVKNLEKTSVKEFNISRFTA